MANKMAKPGPFIPSFPADLQQAMRLVCEKSPYPGVMGPVNMKMMVGIQVGMFIPINELSVGKSFAFLAFYMRTQAVVPSALILTRCQNEARIWEREAHLTIDQWPGPVVIRIGRLHLLDNLVRLACQPQVKMVPTKALMAISENAHALSKRFSARLVKADAQ